MHFLLHRCYFLFELNVSLLTHPYFSINLDRLLVIWFSKILFVRLTNHIVNEWPVIITTTINHTTAGYYMTPKVLATKCYHQHKCLGKNNNQHYRWRRDGNRKLQHFKRKCRTRGFTEEQITARIQNRNHTIPEQLHTDQTIPEQTHGSSKRKRSDQSLQTLVHSSMKSMSQLSISQEGVCKKLKQSIGETTPSSKEMDDQTSSQQITFYKPSKYLKMPRKLLLHSLHLQLNCRLKKKKEQHFILVLLKIMDRQFCLEQIHYLYQTYLKLGLQHQVLSVSIPVPLSLALPLIALFQEWGAANHTIKWTWYHPEISDGLFVAITKANRFLYNGTNSPINNLSSHTTSSGKNRSAIERICSFTSFWFIENNHLPSEQITWSYPYPRSIETVIFVSSDDEIGMRNNNDWYLISFYLSFAIVV